MRRMHIPLFFFFLAINKVFFILIQKDLQVSSLLWSPGVWSLMQKPQQENQNSLCPANTPSLPLDMSKDT